MTSAVRSSTAKEFVGFLQQKFNLDFPMQSTGSPENIKVLEITLVASSCVAYLHHHWFI